MKREGGSLRKPVLEGCWGIGMKMLDLQTFGGEGVRVRRREGAQVDAKMEEKGAEKSPKPSSPAC